MKSVVHIGTEKTGTTTLQNCLLINQDFLKQNGFGILKSAGKGNNRKLAAFCMADKNVDDYIISNGLTNVNSRNNFKIQLEKELEEEITELSNQVQTVIISSEHFHSRLHSENEIKNLAKLLSKYFSEIEVVVYLRRQDLVALSLYSTACKVGYSAPNIFPPQIKEREPYYNYELLLEKWARVFGEDKIKPVLFDKQKLINQDLITDFFTHLNLKKEIQNNIVKPVNQNSSLSWQVQLALLSFNKIFSREKFDNVNNLNGLRNKLWTKLNYMYSGKSIMPLRADARKFYNIFEESNKRMGIKWFNTSEVFSNDFSMYPEERIDYKLDPEIFDVIFDILKDEIIKPQ